MNRGTRLITLGDITERHTGRTVTVSGITGRLDGVVPIGSGVRLVLTVGGARMFTGAYSPDTDIAIHQEKP